MSIINTIKLGITNGLIEGINAKIRLINARGYGHRQITDLNDPPHARRNHPKTTHNNLGSRTRIR
jgi:hypothetical protein